MIGRFSLHRPDSLDRALTQAADRSARIHAGGTDLLGCLQDDVFPTPENLVILSRIAELRGITATGDGGLTIGAMTTIAEIAASPAVRQRAPALADAAAVVASPQLRNQGTVGGNLLQKPRCWYYRGDFHCLRKGGDMCYAFAGENRFHCIFGGNACYIVHPSDTAPALVALGAVVRLAGRSSSRTVAVEKLHVAPATDPQRETVLEDGEILTHVVIPPPAQGAVSSYRKVGARKAWDFAVAGVALHLVRDGNGVVTAADVVLSGAAPIPWRANAAEARLVGRTLDRATIAAAAGASIEDAEPLSDNAYKLPLFEGLVTAQLEAIATR